MTRRRYLMAYDIADPKRLRRVCSLMEDHGERLQYSVFLCDLSTAELAELEAAVTAVMHLLQDSVVRIDLGPTFSPAAIRMIGRGHSLPKGGPQIV
ncbi:MAG TPA: CRISPR-associated endonuclease Cas2 [Mycobacterium sp.]|nr:CRISPR-associated endonuclease Cas2 [Mycobacterium sp.]